MLAVLIGAGVFVYKTGTPRDDKPRRDSHRAGRVAAGKIAGASPRAYASSLDAAEVRDLLQRPGAVFGEHIPREWRRALLARWTELKADSAAAFAAGSDAADAACVVEAWARRDPTSVIAWLREHASRELAEQVLVADGAVPTLPVGVALTLYSRLGADADSQLGLRLLSRASKTEISDWLRDAPTSPLRQRTLVQFVQLHPADARNVALDAICALPEGAERRQLIGLIATEWSRTDPVAAAAWLDERGDPRGQTPAWASMTAQWAEHYPVQAAKIAAEMPPGPARHEAIVSAISGWSRNDPSAAAEWVSRFPEGALRCESMRHVVFNWTMRNAEAAGQWILRLPGGASRDAAVDTYLKLASRAKADRAAGHPPRLE